METKIESPTSGIVESQGERFEMRFFETDILVTDSKMEAAPESKRSRASLTPPIAKPESVMITLSPDGSPSGQSPASEMKHPYPDILESLTPLSPIPPVKFSSQRAQRLNKTRWWNKVYSNVEIISTDEDSQRFQSFEISLSEVSEVQRETNV